MTTAQSRRAGPAARPRTAGSDLVITCLTAICVLRCGFPVSVTHGTTASQASAALKTSPNTHARLLQLQM